MIDIHCGYHGPRPSTPNQRAQSKSPKETRPRSQTTQESPDDPPLGYPKGTRPKSQSVQERPTNPPSRCLGISYPERLFTQVFPFPIDNSTKRGCLPALHGISIRSPMNWSARLQETRNALLAASYWEGSYVKSRISHPSPNIIGRNRLLFRKNGSAFLLP